tara:strand:+ start:521 stop:1744 length:1224 start_codon:yes stop_codon:yes gene_type:complete
MSAKQSIYFESFIPKDKFKSFDNSNKKKFLNLIKIAKENVNEEKNVFGSFSRNFRLNFDLKELKKYKKFKRIVTIGLGGSILGTQATNLFLKKKSKKELIFINNLDTDQIQKLNKIKGLKNSLFIIVSKSGNTIEVLSIINSLKSKAQFNRKNCLIITSNIKNHLINFAKKFNIRIILHRQYIGGRYSIFSESALVPCYLMGINILKLKKNILNFLDKKNHILINNLLKLSKVYESKKINSLILLNYCQGLEHFLLWCQQLIAESLGKKGKGIIPLISIGPRDHHSLLQLYLDGPRDNYFYIFSLKEKRQQKKNKELFSDVLNNNNIFEVIKNQKKAMITLLKKKNIPYLSIEISKRNEETLGELFSYFMLETIFIGKHLGINPFNQPAVEQLKKLTTNYLSKKNQK